MNITTRTLLGFNENGDLRRHEHCSGGLPPRGPGHVPPPMRNSRKACTRRTRPCWLLKPVPAPRAPRVARVEGLQAAKPDQPAEAVTMSCDTSQQDAYSVSNTPATRQHRRSPSEPPREGRHAKRHPAPPARPNQAGEKARAPQGRAAESQRGQRHSRFRRHNKRRRDASFLQLGSSLKIMFAGSLIKSAKRLNTRSYYPTHAELNLLRRIEHGNGPTPTAADHAVCPFGHCNAKGGGGTGDGPRRKRS